MSDPMTFSDFARHLGCARSYVSKLKNDGRLVLTKVNGKDRVVVEASVERIQSTRDPSKSLDPSAPPPPLDLAPGKEIVPSSLADADEEEPEDPALEKNPNYQAARARRENANATRAEIELAQLKGTLVKWEDLEPVLNNIFAVLRTSLESLEDTLAPGLAAESDESNVRNLLSESIESALTDLSRAFMKMSKETLQ